MGLNNPISAVAAVPTNIILVTLLGPLPTALVSLRTRAVLTWQVQRMGTTITTPPVLRAKLRFYKVEMALSPALVSPRRSHYPLLETGLCTSTWRAARVTTVPTESTFLLMVFR